MVVMDKVSAQSVDQQLRDRASRVIPQGMYGHLRAAGLPPGYPQFFESAQGCRIVDVNGKDYIDYMCSWGPIVLGHRHPAVDAAFLEQLQRGDCLNGPTEKLVELAERLVGLLPHADWAVFAKNGTDATTTAVTVARAGTKRRKVLVATGAYHGAVPWCSPSVAGVTVEDRAHLINYTFNDTESLARAVADAGSDLAAIVVSAFKHDMGQALVMPTTAFAQAARNFCDAAGAALIIDEVRAGFRLSLQGSWEALGVGPDISAWSKAIANGYPLAAVTGNDRFRAAFGEIYVTGSFWMGAAAMAASLATLDTLERTNGVEHMVAMGNRLRSGVAALASKHGVPVIQSGPAQMPLIQFKDDHDTALGNAFCADLLKRGVYMHPRHNMFLSCAHQESDIDETLHHFEASLSVVSEQLGQ